MPLPEHALTIKGGCHCKAVRYEVSVPPFAQRPQTPYRTPGADVGDLRLPAVYVCACNDCRAATAAILPHALVTPIRMVQASALAREPEPEGSAVERERQWSPAAEVFDFTNPSLKDTCLAFYKSSPGRSRWFCSHCGTNVAYSIDDGVLPEEWGWPKMLDIWLGTVDREDLEKDYMSPERMLWCDMGVPWIRKLATSGGGGMPCHPLTKIDKLVGDNVGATSEELAEHGK